MGENSKHVGIVEASEGPDDPSFMHCTTHEHLGTLYIDIYDFLTWLALAPDREYETESCRRCPLAEYLAAKWIGPGEKYEYLEVNSAYEVSFVNKQPEKPTDIGWVHFDL